MALTAGFYTGSRGNPANTSFDKRRHLDLFNNTVGADAHVPLHDKKIKLLGDGAFWKQGGGTNWWVERWIRATKRCL